MTAKCSSAHAEIMALSLAQQTLATHTLGVNRNSWLVGLFFVIAMFGWLL
jgi:hypothetical protein